MAYNVEYDWEYRFDERYNTDQVFDKMIKDLHNQLDHATRELKEILKNKLKNATHVCVIYFVLLLKFCITLKAYEFDPDQTERFKLLLESYSWVQFAIVKVMLNSDDYWCELNYYNPEANKYVQMNEY